MRLRTVKWLLACSALTMAGGAFAQDKPAGAGSASANDGQSIVVTGTRIVRDGYTAPTPVTVATTEELSLTTPSGVVDGLNKLPQFANSLSAAKYPSNFSNLPVHGNIINLRGLGTPGATATAPRGPLRTLILFDGQRVAPTEYLGTIDTNVLPQLLMKRVDVVTGGASAAWGSDAVAGVVNFVLDKKFTGITGVIQGGVAERGYNNNQRVGVAAGFTFGEGRGHILLSAEFDRNSGMKRADRDFSNLGYDFVGATPGCVNPNPTTEPTACSLGGRLNPYTIGTDIRISSIAPNGRITASTVSGNPLVGQVINNDGTTRAFNTGTAIGSAGLQSGGDGYKITQQQAAIIPGKNYKAFGRLSYDVADGVNAYAQVLFARSTFTYPTQTNALVGPSEAVQIFSGNPYLTPAMQATIPNAGDSITVQQYDAGQPQPLAKERTDYWMANAGLDGESGRFKWSVNYSHGESKHSMDTSGLFDNKKLYAAVDVVLVGGVPTCRVLTDPTVAAQYTGCKPLNVLRGNAAAATPDGYAYATGTSSYHATFKQDALTANVSGSLFDMPAGPVDFAAGLEYRHQSLLLTSNADPGTLAGTSTNPVTLAAQTAAIRTNYFAGLRGVPSGALYYWLTNVGSASGSTSVKEGFGEVAIPLLKDTPGFKELNVNGAFRVTDYSTSGTVTTWKVGGSWKPVDGFSLRATYSLDIRAPNLFEMFGGPQSSIGIVNDPLLNGIGSGLNQNVSVVSAGNPNLRPEKAKTLTIGGVVSPAFMPGFSMSLDYYSINLNNAIDQLGAQQIITNCTNSSGTDAVCGLITRTSPTAFPNSVTTAPANIAFIKTRGLDFDASYRKEVGKGMLSVRLYANYLLQFDTQQFVGAPTLHYAGVNVIGSYPAGSPRFKGNLTLDYSTDTFGVTLGEQMIGSMRLDNPGALPNGAQSYFVNPHVPTVMYTDFTIRGKFDLGSGRKIEPFLTINNLFDKSPPIIPGTTPGVNIPTNIAVYDFVGRAYTAGIRFKF